MRLIDDLRREHLLIERVVGSLFAYARARARGEGDVADGQAYLRFFRLYAGRFHHAREEDVLFPALVATEVPADRGPLAALLHAHQAMAHLLDGLEPLLDGAPPAGGGALLVAQARRYGEALLHHLDAEDSVLFPESEIRFRQANLGELPARGPDLEEEAAREAGSALVVRYPPVELPEIFRGDGCTACADYGKRCEGVEREWWSEHEWDDAADRLGNG